MEEDGFVTQVDPTWDKSIVVTDSVAMHSGLDTTYFVRSFRDEGATLYVLYEPQAISGTAPPTAWLLVQVLKEKLKVLRVLRVP